MAYMRADPVAARDTYRLLFKACALHQTPSAAWYAAMAQFGIARTSSRLTDTTETRLALLNALRGGFWNFDALDRDSIIRNVAGKFWFDSLVNLYKELRLISTPTWAAQQPLVVLPASDPIVLKRLAKLLPVVPAGLRIPLTHHAVLAMDSTLRSMVRKAQVVPLSEFGQLFHEKAGVRQPQLIVALHGGCASYQEFARHWSRVADSVGLYVLVPAGNIRHSEDMNSWEGSIESIDETVTGALDRFEQQCGYEPDVYIAGFSQGGMAAIKLGLMHPDRYHDVISVAGLLDGPLPVDALSPAAQSGLRIYAMSGEFDSPTFRASLEAAGRQCTQSAIPFKLEIVPGTIHEVPHDFDAHFATAWDWVRAREAARVAQTSMLKSRE